MTSRRLTAQSSRAGLRCLLAGVLLCDVVAGNEKYLLYHAQPNDARGMHELRKLQMLDHKYQVTPLHV
ncbi:unnamed protein product [Angiostrongylus costaricensis]|uniref:Secreted protein n=1 Tax=Angiostrongylus costaricensis TaxID=334426 RepID=A0A0R3PHZ4_ANGCS|nr:unnamed protein product [Angiostrongylus costaricensis]